MTERTLLTEEVTVEEFNKLEKALTSFFAKFKIDVSFRAHFRDRINDARNYLPITRERLLEIFNKLIQHKNYSKLQNMKFGQEGLMIYKDVNFVYTLDKVRDKIQLRFITAMSKKNFVSNSKSDFNLKLERHYIKIFESLDART